MTREPLPHYLRDVLAMAGAGVLVPGEAYDIEVRHDDWCALLTGRGACDCKPDFVVQWLAEVQR